MVSRVNSHCQKQASLLGPPYRKGSKLQTNTMILDFKGLPRVFFAKIREGLDQLLHGSQ